MPPSCSPVFQHEYSHFSVLCMHFQYFTKSSIYDVCTQFSQFSVFSIYGQNSVKILTNPYTWRQRRLVIIFAECAFYYRTSYYAMYCFCLLSGLTWVAWVYIAAYGKRTLIRIHGQPPLTWSHWESNHKNALIPTSRNSIVVLLPNQQI